MEFMVTLMARTLRRIASGAAGVALLAALLGSFDDGGRKALSPLMISLAAGELTIASPAFADGAPIPVQFSCKGANVAPPLTWSAPTGAGELALVVDDPDAAGYIHWIVTGIG